MLHNSGAYGPNETPINASVPLNMSQVASAHSVPRNIQNMSDINQQSLQRSSGHYNLPSYSAYSHEPGDISSHLHTFPTDPLKGFQPDYLPQNAPSFHNPKWQNGMTPLNLNAQSTFVPNTHNFHTPYFKNPPPNSTTIPSNLKEQFLRDKTSLNTADTSSGSNNSYLYNPYQDRFSHYNHNYETNISMSQINSPMDVSKRKSIENTVKLIEDILINTTKQAQNAQKKAESNKNEIETLVVIDNKSLSEDEDDKNSIVDKYSSEEENSPKEIPEDETKNDKSEETTDTANKITLISDKPADNAENKTQEESQEVIPKVFAQVDVKVEVNIERYPSKISIKLEDVSDDINPLDNDNEMVFQRDLNGYAREDVTDDNIVISENSIAEAKDATKSGSVCDKYFTCPHCGLLFNQPKRFLIHAKWHKFGLTHNMRIEEAREKEMQRKQRKEARAVDQLHKVIEEDGTTYPCKDCSKVFSSKGSLKNHRTRFHSGRIRECNICGAAALGWAGLRAHAATHAAPYKCDVCNKQFRHKHSMLRHSETHVTDKDKTLPCDICGKLFHVAARLKEHMRCHARAERGPTFQCSYCAKSFIQSYSLVIHERTHRNEKPYTCDICNTSYATNSSLKRHVKVSHNSAKPYQCPECSRCFISERGLVAHTNKLHPADDDDDDDGAPRRRRKRAGKAKSKGGSKGPKAKKNKKASEPETEEEIQDGT